MPRSLAWFGAACLLFVLLPAARATTMVELSLDQMIEEAESVFLGVVEARGTRVAILEGRATPVTITRFRVTSWLKGEGPAVVSLREPGGAWAGATYRVDGTPTYAVGEEVVVFAERDGEGHLRTYGLQQGKFLVSPARGEVPKTVHRDFGGIGLVRWRGERMILEHGGIEPAATLEELLRYIAARRGGPKR